MLLGRVAEVERIGELLTRARQERLSSALIVHGEPGVGKTALLEDAVRRSRGDFTLLLTRPLEVEAELGFAGLFDLVRPVQDRLARLPEAQRAALAGALALGPPAPGDRFAVAAATLSLLAEAASDAPVLAVVDDAHWLDAPSREALLFAARRIANEGVVLLLGMRERDWIRSSGLATLALGGLGPADAAALLDRTGAEIEPGVRRRIVEGTHGNPLALLEATGKLSDDERRGSVPIRAPLPVGDALHEAFAQRLDALPQPTRSALLIVAASDTGATRELLRALDRADLDSAEAAGLITVTPERIAFRHPLIRSAAYHYHDVVDRREAHRALAAQLGADPRAAWHLAAAGDGPDERVAAQLEAVGQAALTRSAYASAAAALEHAATLSPADGDRLRRTTDGARALWLAGDPQRASDLLGGVVDLATDPLVRADLQHLNGITALVVRPLPETYAMLVAEAERVEPHDSERAAGLWAQAALVSFSLGDPPRAEHAARGALGRADAGGPTALAAAVVLAAALTVDGRVSEAWDVLEPRFARLAELDPFGELAASLSGFLRILVWLERWEPAAILSERFVHAVRAANAPGMLAFPLVMLAEFELRRGRLSAAYAAASESVQLAVATQQPIIEAFALIALAGAEAARGDEDDCRAHVAAALELGERSGTGALRMYGHAALGSLELARGRPERAAGELETAAAAERENGVKLATVIQSRGDLIEAHARRGAPAQAQDQLDELERQGEATGMRWTRGVAARGRGLLTGEGFEEALAQFGTDMPLERARTQLALGMRHRRAQQRKLARAALTEALECFEAAGAVPWAEQARSELGAAGATSVPSTNHSLRELTPQELQISLIAARGATNREAAAALFLSEKTVEFHLRNAYRKLGVRSRAQLVRRVEGLP